MKKINIVSLIKDKKVKAPVKQKGKSIKITNHKQRANISEENTKRASHVVWYERERESEGREYF